MVLRRRTRLLCIRWFPLTSLDPLQEPADCWPSEVYGGLKMYDLNWSLAPLLDPLVVFGSPETELLNLLLFVVRESLQP